MTVWIVATGTDRSRLTSELFLPVKRVIGWGELGRSSGRFPLSCCALREGNQGLWGGL